jgi:hypothetical protein
MLHHRYFELDHSCSALVSELNHGAEAAGVALYTGQSILCQTDCNAVRKQKEIAILCIFQPSVFLYTRCRDPVVPPTPSFSSRCVEQAPSGRPSTSTPPPPSRRRKPQAPIAPPRESTRPAAPPDRVQATVDYVVSPCAGNLRLPCSGRSTVSAGRRLPF